MALPNVARAVKILEQDVILRTVSVTTLDGEPQYIYTDELIRASIQVARPDELLVDEIDRNIAYIKVHARLEFENSQYIIYKGKSYKIIQVSNWVDYGYSRCFGAENKRNIDT